MACSLVWARCRFSGSLVKNSGNACSTTAGSEITGQDCGPLSGGIDKTAKNRKLTEGKETRLQQCC